MFISLVLHLNATAVFQNIFISHNLDVSLCILYIFSLYKEVTGRVYFIFYHLKIIFPSRCLPLWNNVSLPTTAGQSVLLLLRMSTDPDTTWIQEAYFVHFQNFVTMYVRKIIGENKNKYCWGWSCLARERVTAVWL